MLSRLLLLCAVLVPSLAAAADINIVRTNDGSVTFIAVSGELVQDDGDRFAAVARRTPQAVVVFVSPGGALIAGIQIGQLIRLRRYPTFVAEDRVCASACALAWAAGTPRVMQQGARIGFHAAFDRDTHAVTGAGNALVGAYLDRLGLSLEAVMYAAKANPDEITWLTEGDARRIGMDLRVVPASLPSGRAVDPVPSAKPPFGKDQASTAPVLPGSDPAPHAATVADRAKSFVGDYFAHWSETADEALAFFDASYASRVTFYGSPIGHAELMQHKRDYTGRWPVRVYAARPDGMRAECDEVSRTCQVSGVVDWDCRSPARNARSTGSANFSLTLAMTATSGRIVAESGSVLTRSIE